MVSTLNKLQEKYSQVRRKFCFYLDIQDHGLARSISRRLQDMGLQEEVLLTGRVTHVVRDLGSGGRAVSTCPPRRDSRADAMLQRVASHHQLPHNHSHVTLTTQKAINLLDKLYDTFFTAPRKAHVRVFSKHFLKIEFLDKLCRPVFKEFDEWPEISLEPNQSKEKKEKRDTSRVRVANVINQNNITNNKIGQKMTRKSRPRIKDKEEKETKGGYCEMCNSEYVDAALHRSSAVHTAFARDHNNFLALDELIAAGDVASFLSRSQPPELSPPRRSLPPDLSPPRNGTGPLHKRSRRGADAQLQREARQYYKVVGVNTKLRSSGGFATAKKKDSPPTCNGQAKPLVVKFRKVRRSELSVLSDEAEQFMFPRRASSSGSTSSNSESERRGDSPPPAPPPQPPPALERRRLARPLALKEESSEEDAWQEDRRRRKRRPPPVQRRTRRTRRHSETLDPVEPTPESVPLDEPKPEPPTEVATAPAAAEPVVSAEPVEKCMKWEDGRLKYTPAVERLEFAFESVPHSEPWYETFRRQDEDRLQVRNVPKYFALYTKSPKLPYEIGHLPPLKPNCCPLSSLVARREERRRGPGTRGTKRLKLRRRPPPPAEPLPRKSPREHASTLAMLGLLQRRPPDDNKSTASEDALPDPAPPPPDDLIASFLDESFHDDLELVDSELGSGGEEELPRAAPDVARLMSECDDCSLLQDELARAVPPARKPRLKKKNRTGWPTRRRPVPAAPTDSTAPSSPAPSSPPAASPPRSPAASPAPSAASEEPLRLAVQVLVDEAREERTRRRRALEGAWLQPVVRVARVAPRALRSAGRQGAGAAGRPGARRTR